MAILLPVDFAKITDALGSLPRAVGAVVTQDADAFKSCVRIRLPGVTYEIDHVDGDGKLRSGDGCAAIASALLGAKSP